MSETTRLRDDARSIWQAGVDAVDSGKLLKNVISNSGETLILCGHQIPLSGLESFSSACAQSERILYDGRENRFGCGEPATLGRIVVVGAGKAGAGMATAFEEAIGSDLLAKTTGWINVPADCVRRLKKIHLHAARPAGMNEPTREGVEGSNRILELVSQLGPNDLCIVLLSGGGSALLPAPVTGITLEDKQAVTRFLMHAGATINELNCVRKRLSQIKGGNLARASSAGLTVSLIISDVIGDPLETIASGPTVTDSSSDADALAVLQKYSKNIADVPSSVVSYLTKAASQSQPPASPFENVDNHVIGNNAVALNAAAEKAMQLGYKVHSLGSDNQGIARDVGRELAAMCLTVRNTGKPISVPACILSGGEPVVHVVDTDRPRKGGRNQELALAALEYLWEDGMDRIAILSGGTDGEDGPTDAAGALIDAGILDSAKSQGLLTADFLAINNSYSFFEQSGGLLKTGPTHTNVMDLRVAIIDR